MPLVDLRTNLKSFKYGHDRPGGGDSGQPFITTDIETGKTVASVSSRNILRLFGIREIPGIPNLDTLLNRSRTGRIVNEALGGDEFIRGGITGAAQASLNDALRIGLFFTSLPKGPIFIAKQVGLQLSSPKLEVKKGTTAVFGDLFRGNVGSALGTLTGGILGPTRVYNLGLNTVAQVPVNAFGGHFYRHGVLPVQNNDTKYEAVVEFNNRGDSKNNRLVNLANTFELGDNKTEINQGVFNLSRARKENRREHRSRVRTVNKTNKVFRQDAIESRNLLAQQSTLPQPTQPNQFLTGPNLSIGGDLNWTTPNFSMVPSDYVPPTPPPPTPIRSLPLSQFGYNPIKKPKKPKLDLTGRVIDSYIGGPSSVYGIGLTLINRYEFSEDKDKYEEAIEIASENAGRGLDLSDGQRKELTNSNLIENSLGNGTITATGEYNSNSISDYSDVTTDLSEIAKGLTLGTNKTYGELIGKILNAESYVKTNRSKNGWATEKSNAVKNDNKDNSGLSSTPISGGKIIYKNTYGETVTINKASWNAASREVRVGSGRRDSINLTPLFKSDTGTATDVIKIGDTLYTINDLAKFRIEAIDGDKPEKSVFMVFRAYLTDLSDDVSAEWSDIKYAGRGEKFYIYDGFTRTINVSFKVAALSADEMNPMYRKLNNLMGNLMPDYSPGNNGFPGTTSGVMRGPLVRMTIGNWIDSQPGILKSLSYKVPQDSPWEIALNEPTPGRSKELVLPHIVEVNLSFTPIGSQTQTVNKTPNKAGGTEHTSHIAQNFNGASTGEPNYINGQSIQTAIAQKDEPSTIY